MGLAPGGEAAEDVADAVALVTAAGVKLALADEGDPAEPAPAPQAQITMTMAAHMALDLIWTG